MNTLRDKVATARDLIERMALTSAGTIGCGEAEVMTSIAISLKRIADAFERAEAKP